MGDPSSDHRADIYSFGCLAYEVLTGKPPFHDMPLHQVVAAHMSTVPAPVTEVRTDVPDIVGSTGGAVPGKDPAARPQTAGEALAVLEGSATVTAPAVSPIRQPRRLVRPRTAMLAAVMAAAVGAGSLSGCAASAPEPFPSRLPCSRSAIPAATPRSLRSPTDWRTRSSRRSAASLASRCEAATGRGRIEASSAVDPGEVGRKLKVDYIVTGVLREASGRWILSTELTRTADATELWNGRFQVPRSADRGRRGDRARRRPMCCGGDSRATLGTAPPLRREPADQESRGLPVVRARARAPPPAWTEREGECRRISPGDPPRYVVRRGVRGVEHGPRALPVLSAHPGRGCAAGTDGFGAACDPTRFHARAAACRLGAGPPPRVQLGPRGGPSFAPHCAWRPRRRGPRSVRAPSAASPAR